MHQILSKLCRTHGVLGGLVVNKDGIVAASEVSVDIEEQGIGAVASSILAAIEGAVRRLSLGRFTRFVIQGSEHKVAIVDAGPALLLVILSREVNMGMVNIEIQEACRAIIQRAKIDA